MLLRLYLDHVEAKIPVAEEVERLAKRAARKWLRDQCRAQAKEKINAKIEGTEGRAVPTSERYL